MTPRTYGTFDLVLSWAPYHLRHPPPGIDIASPLSHDTLVVRRRASTTASSRPTAASAGSPIRACGRCSPTRAMSSPATSPDWWGPSLSCLEPVHYPSGPWLRQLLLVPTGIAPRLGVTT